MTGWEAHRPVQRKLRVMVQRRDELGGPTRVAQFGEIGVHHLERPDRTRGRDQIRSLPGQRDDPRIPIGRGGLVPRTSGKGRCYCEIAFLRKNCLEYLCLSSTQSGEST